MHLQISDAGITIMAICRNKNQRHRLSNLPKVRELVKGWGKVWIFAAWLKPLTTALLAPMHNQSITFPLPEWYQSFESRKTKHDEIHIQWNTTQSLLKNETLLFATTWMDLEDNMLNSEKKDKHYMISLTYGV